MRSVADDDDDFFDVNKSDDFFPESFVSSFLSSLIKSQIIISRNVIITY